MAKKETGTKKVIIHLAALTRCFCDIEMEVPADMTDEQLNDLVNEKYEETDGGEFQDDHDFWERGECFYEIVPEKKKGRG